MSANYIVDLGPCIGFNPTAGSFFPASGANISNIVDLINFNSYTNLTIIGAAQFPSGQMRIAVQTSDSTTSGSFTDPTSGLAAFPTVFQSGGLVILNSGGGTTATAAAAGFQQGGVFGAFVSGQSIFSGAQAFAGFQRPHRYARVVVLSGDFLQFNGGIGFICQPKTTGSGGGFTLSPSSGTVNV